jgi:3-deoxy-D-manno-octulosonic-acid transferase
MHGVPRFVYNTLVIPLLLTAMHLLRRFNEKIERGVTGREHLFARLETAMAKLPHGKPRIWFHSSSLGEFEQAKPIIAEIKRRDPSVQIVVSFFSPSGYEPSRKYKLADVITYLPFDTVHDARTFVSIVRPTAAVMVRYDVWPNHIDQLAKAGIPVYLANATMRTTSRRFLPVIKNFHSQVYSGFRAILTVSEADASMFSKFGLKGVSVRAIGDTRFDQVLIRKKEAEVKHLIAPSILEGKKIVVVGSSWEADEDVLLPVMRDLHAANPSLLMILVPHEPTVENLERIEGSLNGSLSSIRFSDRKSVV